MKRPKNSSKWLWVKLCFETHVLVTNSIISTDQISLQHFSTPIWKRERDYCTEKQQSIWWKMKPFFSTEGFHFFQMNFDSNLIILFPPPCEQTCCNSVTIKAIHIFWPLSISSEYLSVFNTDANECHGKLKSLSRGIPAYYSPSTLTMRIARTPCCQGLIT